MANGNGKHPKSGGNGKHPKAGGNGKLKPTNGKVKRKRGRPKSKDALSTKLIQTEAVKADGSPTKMAKALGIAPQTADKHLKKPEIKAVVLTAREKAMKAAGLTREEAYLALRAGLGANATASYEGVVTESLGVPDYKERRQSAQAILGAYGDLKEVDTDKVPVIFNFYIPEKKPLVFPTKDTIDV